LGRLQDSTFYVPKDKLDIKRIILLLRKKKGEEKKSPRPVNVDANHLLTTHPSSAKPGAMPYTALLGFFFLINDWRHKSNKLD